MRALTRRMSHIDEQISQIFHFLSPLNAPASNTFSPISKPAPSTPPQSRSSPRATPMSPMTAVLSPETNLTSLTMSPLFETPSFYSDLTSKSNVFDPNQAVTSPTDALNYPRLSRTSEQMSETPPLRQISGFDSGVLTVPPPPSVYNRSTASSFVSLSSSGTSRGSISNKIAPAPASASSSLGSRQPLGTTFQPISNTRLNPGRSPKPKTRFHHTRPGSKTQSKYSDKPTVIELESPTQQEPAAKSAPLLQTTSRSLPSSRSSGGSVFRRLMTSSGGSSEKTPMASSSTLLYPPTSDDEHAASAASSGNDDDDYRPLTSSSSKHHHQTPL